MIHEFGIWSVNTEFGITCLEPSYNIEASRLWETRVEGGRTYSDWYLHMAHKTWISQGGLEDFFHAFEFALDYFHHLMPEGQPQILWEESKKVARRIVSSR